MYPLIRRIHGYSGLLLILFVVMYFATGLLLTEPVVLPQGSTRRSEQTVSVSHRSTDDEQALARQLQDVLGIRGKRMPPRSLETGGWEFFWTRPGTQVRVRTRSGSDSVTVTREERSAWGTAAQLHRIHGYGGGLLFDVWAILYDIVSLAMILFACSGVYLWWKRTPDRRLGWALLATGWGLTFATYAYLWLTP